MSGAVGSTPSFARSGLPVFSDSSSFAFSSLSRIISATPFFKYASCSSTGLNFACVIDLVQRSCSVRLDYAPSYDFELAFEHDAHRLRVNAMLLRQDSRRKRLFRV